MAVGIGWPKVVFLIKCDGKILLHQQLRADDMISIKFTNLKAY
jgi:hypothetical protein